MGTTKATIIHLIVSKTSTNHFQDAMYVEEKISHVKNLPNKMENNQSDYGTKDMHYINIQDRRVWHLASVGRET